MAKTSSNKRAEKWRDDLRAFIASKRQESALPAQEDLGPEEFNQFRLIGSELINWYNKGLEQFIGERIIFEKLKGFDLTTFAVVLTSIPGLVATQVIWSKPQKTCVFLTPEEFEAWTRQNPDEEFIYHLQHWSYFEQPNAKQGRKIAKEFPERELSACRLHTRGDLYGANMGSEISTLLQWTGEEFETVEIEFERVRY